MGTGLQQVVDRPFGVSEWIHVYPSLYSAEGPAIFAAYGMGLQITSQTGQLRWDYSQQGYFTVDTPGTKAVVGFAEGKEQRLGDVTVTLQCPYASLFLTASGKNETLANARSALLSAVARNCNSGFKVLTFDNRVLDNGNGPVMLEPVKARIAFDGRQIGAVNVLDHDGKRTGKTVHVTGGMFEIDGTQDKTLYYEVLFR